MVPPKKSQDSVDLPWVVEVLQALFQRGGRAAVLCELGVSRSTAVAAAYLHLGRGLAPSTGMRMALLPPVSLLAPGSACRVVGGCGWVLGGAGMGAPFGGPGLHVPGRGMRPQSGRG